MNKHASQIVVAVVCGLLGFLLAYQYKVLAGRGTTETNYNSDILAEVESLKNEKEELKATNSELNQKLTALEQGAAQAGDVELEIKNQLDNARKQLGLMDVQGQGVKIKLSLKSSMFGTNDGDSSRLLTDNELVTIVNSLWFSKAEAVSINGFRITPQTGIKVAGNVIWVGAAGRVDPSEDIEILAIGEIAKLKEGLKFQPFEYGNFSNYVVDIKEDDEIVIEKTTQSLKSDYIKSVQN
jgi:uncharacterized protein YlxW (UPF0749 family)